MAQLESYFLPSNLDPHTWDQELSEPCRLFVDGRTCKTPHGMVCSRCGLRRYGPFRGPGNDHFFTYYRDDGGQAHELLPPCRVQKLNPEIEIRNIQVCAVCQQIIMNTSQGCRYGHEKGVRVLRACVLVNVPQQEAVPCLHP